MRWYLHPLFLYTGLRNFMAYLQYIPPRGRSGLQKHPGDKVFFFLRGKGYTTIDGMRHDWGFEDLLILPIRPDGVTYQHVNDSDEPAFLFACEPNLAFIFDLDRGSSFEELEAAPEFSDPSTRNTVAVNPPTF
jgi:gentisate 1,2-dioxygenase